jgi:hypothetical protein
MIRLVGPIELPSGVVAVMEAPGSPAWLEASLPIGAHRVLVCEEDGNLRVEQGDVIDLARGERLGTVVIEGYSLFIGDADAIGRASGRDGERFWSELLARADSNAVMAAGSFDLASGVAVAFTGMQGGEHGVYALVDGVGRRRGILVEG